MFANGAGAGLRPDRGRPLHGARLDVGNRYDRSAAGRRGGISHRRVLGERRLQRAPPRGRADVLAKTSAPRGCHRRLAATDTPVPPWPLADFDRGRQPRHRRFVGAHSGEGFGGHSNHRGDDWSWSIVSHIRL